MSGFEDFWPNICDRYHMNLYQFISLDKEVKAELLWDLGIFLMTRPYYNGKVNLYGIEDFYVEVYYNCALQCIEEICCFKCVEYLDAYLDIIDLNDLYR